LASWLLVLLVLLVVVVVLLLPSAVVVVAAAAEARARLACSLISSVARAAYLEFNPNGSYGCCTMLPAQSVPAQWVPFVS
jgi:hypothetical protein